MVRCRPGTRYEIRAVWNGPGRRCNVRFAPRCTAAETQPPDTRKSRRSTMKRLAAFALALLGVLAATTSAGPVGRRFLQGQDHPRDRRLLARRLRLLGAADRCAICRSYIPGNPAFVVENMPGAGSLIATNHLYNRAAQDGTVLGSVSRNIPHYAFAKKPNVAVRSDEVQLDRQSGDRPTAAASRAPTSASTSPRTCSSASFWSAPTAPAPRCPKCRCC